MTKEEVSQLSNADRYAKLYQYHETDHFKDLTDAEAAVKAMEACNQFVQVRPSVPIVQSSAIAINYLKNRLVYGGFVSMSRELFNLAMQSDYVPAFLTADRLLSSLAVPVDHAGRFLDMVMFQIVDAWPERKYRIRSVHTSQSRTLIRVSKVNFYAEHIGGLSADSSGEQVDMDILQLCGERFPQLMQSLCTWTAQPGALAVEIFPTLVGPATLLKLPDFVDDDDDLLSLVPLASKYTSLQISPVPDPGTSLVVANSAIPPGGLGLVKALVDAKAFAEIGNFVELSTLGFDDQIVNTLSVLSVISTRSFPPNSIQVAVNLSVLKISAISHCSKPIPLALAHFRGVALNQYSKLEMIQYLLKRGFMPIEQPQKALLRTGGAWEIWPPGLYKTKQYLMALCYSPIIFAKQGSLPGIVHQGTDSYYKCLLRLTDLTDIAAKSFDELINASDRTFTPMLRDIPEPTHHPDRADDQIEDQLAIENEGLDDEALPSAPPLAIQIRAVHMAEDAVPCRVVGFRPMRACFDNWTHSSGNRRVFIHCSLHDACRLYIFIKDFPSTERAISYLFAWSHAGTLFPRREQCKDHIANKPQDSDIDLVERDQFH